MARHLKTQHAIYPGDISPPGYANLDANVAALKQTSTFAYPTTLETGGGRHCIPGYTGDVYDPITSFHDRMGGFGHVMLEAQAYLLTHDETVDSLRLFSEEEMPRLKEKRQSTAGVFNPA